MMIIMRMMSLTMVVSRVLVASRTLAAGEEILRENPVTLGPVCSTGGEQVSRPLHWSRILLLSSRCPPCAWDVTTTWPPPPASAPPVAGQSAAVAVQESTCTGATSPPALGHQAAAGTWSVPSSRPWAGGCRLISSTMEVQTHLASRPSTSSKSFTWKIC